MVLTKSITAKKAFSNAKRKEIYDFLSSGKHNIKSLQNKFKMSQSAAQRWYTRKKKARTFEEFAPKNGRRPPMSEESWEKIISEMTQASDKNLSMPHESNDKNVPTLKQLVEQTMRECDRTNTKYPSEKTLRRLCQKYNFVLAKAQCMPMRRIIACNDPLNGISMAVTARFMHNLSNGDWDYVLNLDATAFELNSIDKSRDSRLVWVPQDVKKNYDKTSTPLQTYPTSTGGVGVFAKHMTLVCGNGHAAPFVFIIAMTRASPKKQRRPPQASPEVEEP